VIWFIINNDIAVFSWPVKTVEKIRPRLLLTFIRPFPVIAFRLRSQPDQRYQMSSAQIVKKFLPFFMVSVFVFN